MTNVLDKIDQGVICVVAKTELGWTVNEDVKNALTDMLQAASIVIMPGHFDKIPLKFDKWTLQDFLKHKIRIVPGAIVRYTAYIGPDCVVMPSFVNIGAHVGDGTMIDSFATIGSCCYVGKSCHISSGVVLAGVLEPKQSLPVIIEDNCFIGANAVIAEGVIVGEGSVVAAGVTITGSTRIYNKIDNTYTKGSIPPHSVVISGSYKLNECINASCAIIIKQVDAKTLNKTQINKLLRDACDE